MKNNILGKSNILGCLAAATLGAAIVVATPAMAFRGGGGFGGMHGGFGGGGMHFGGGGFGGPHFGGGGFRGGMVTGRSVFVPGAGRFAGAPFAGQRFAVNRFNNFAFRNRFNNFAFRNRFFFRHHHFRNFAFFGAPFAVGWGWPYSYDYGYGECWRQVWTGYGYNWANLCYNYGY
ncbi:MAG TPA: hypothetical protein VNY06_07490 [Methylocella sp.]|nr:hypothetical protein [Methylocella sp.]